MAKITAKVKPKPKTKKASTPAAANKSSGNKRLDNAFSKALKKGTK